MRIMHARLKCFYCFKLRAVTTAVCVVVTRQRQVCVCVCVCVRACVPACVCKSGCVRIDPLRGPDRIPLNWLLTYILNDAFSRYICCDWAKDSRPPPYHLHIPTLCESYLIVCIHVWANVGQLI